MSENYHTEKGHLWRVDILALSDQARCDNCQMRYRYFVETKRELECNNLNQKETDGR